MILAVALGGALGSVGRYLVVHQATERWGMAFPWGTLAVNVIGGFVIGTIAELSALVWSIAPELRAFLITGILGGFTTFSAFSLEVTSMMERGDWMAAAAYVVASVVLSVGAVFVALMAVRSVVG